MPLLFHLSSDSIAPTRHTSHTLKTSNAVLTASLLLSLLSGIATSPVKALEFQCETPGVKRTIKVDIPGEEHLCEVAVIDPSNGVRDVKWYANYDTLFCSARAYEMRDKYEELWDYTCDKWPDQNGIDVLSASQRTILDQRLKALIGTGQRAEPTFVITGVRAVASTPLDNEAGKLAFQYFVQEADGAETDFTEIVDDEVESWEISAIIINMLTQLDNIPPDGSAVISGITDTGDLRVHSTFVNEESSLCYGSQILQDIGGDGTPATRTPHRYQCRTESTDPASLTQGPLR